MTNTALVDQGGLESRLEARTTHFNLVRLGLAFAVLFDHAGAVLTGLPDTEMVRLFGMSTGYLAVNGFFILSGLLICRSLDRGGVTIRYFTARALRLYPALLVFAVLATFVVAPVVSAVPYWNDPQLLTYLFEVLHFGDTSGAPVGFYPNNPFPLEYASPLWTLRYEVICYVAAPVVFLTGLHRRRGWLLGAVGLSAVLVLIIEPGNPRFDLPDAAAMLVRFSFCFGLGMAVWLWRDRVRVRLRHVLGAALVFCLCGLFQTGLDVPATLLMATLVLWLGLLPGQSEPGAGEADFSYGLYIWHYPVMQILVGSFAVTSAPVLLVLAALIALAIAALSWYLVEKPALRLKLARGGKARNAPIN